jgi:hypothetical protein
MLTKPYCTMKDLYTSGLTNYWYSLFVYTNFNSWGCAFVARNFCKSCEPGREQLHYCFLYVPSLHCRAVVERVRGFGGQHPALGHLGDGVGAPLPRMQEGHVGVPQEWFSSWVIVTVDCLLRCSARVFSSRRSLTKNQTISHPPRVLLSWLFYYFTSSMFFKVNYN